MGMKRFLAQLMADIGAQYNSFETDEQKKKALEIINPKQAKGGFVGIMAVVACDCGTPVPIKASPPDHSMEEMREKIKEAEGTDRELSLIEMEINKDAPEGTALCATNVGFSSVECGECGRKYVAAWEFDCFQINKSVSFPWDDLEGPGRSASGQSYSKRPISETVH